MQQAIWKQMRRTPIAKGGVLHVLACLRNNACDVLLVNKEEGFVSAKLKTS